MGQFSTESLIAVYPFTRQTDGDEIVIGRQDTATFLALPPEAVEVLDYLADGKSVGEAQALYQQRYGEVPDLEDFLGLLESKGFIRPRQAGEDAGASAAAAAPAPKAAAPVRYHFANFPQPLAQKIFSRPVLAACGLLILLALVLIAAEPWIVPSWGALFFDQHMTALRLTLMLLGAFTVFLHEMVHLIAARSLGVPSRIGVSHRMWVIVAETDMTGVWGVPREKRYLPFLAGPLLDAVCAALLTVLFFADSHGWILIPPVLFRVGQAVWFSYLMRLVWQCYFFVRTDFYFAIATLFQCKNLLQDAGDFLKNQVARVIPRVKTVDQSHIPVSEMRVIKWYSVIYILGRAVALYVLAFVFLPLTWKYAVQIYRILSSGYTADPYAFIDALVIGTVVISYQCFGLYLWLRSLIRKGWR